MQNTLKEKLKDAGVTMFHADDVDKVNDVLAENNFEVSLDFIGSLCESELYAGYFSEKLRKIIHLGEVNTDTDIEGLVEEIEDYEREAKDLEASITINK